MERENLISKGSSNQGDFQEVTNFSGIHKLSTILMVRINQ
ncbi:hypothetical protein ACQKIC_15400 [Peribacillus sp. NPDC046944]